MGSTSQLLLQMEERKINLDYVAGFVDGEGCLIIRIQKCSNNRPGTDYLLYFSISNLNKEVLESIRSYLFINYDIKSSLGVMKSVLNHGECYKLVISDIKNTKLVLDLLKDKLIVKSKQCRLLLKFCNSRLNKSRWNYIQEEIDIAQEIKGLNRRGRLHGRT